MSTGYLRMSHEDIPGNETNTTVLATKKLFPRLQSFEPGLGAGFLSRDDELTGSDEPQASTIESADPTWSLAVRMTPDLIGYLLTCMLGLPVTTAGNGVITDPDGATIPAGAHRHVWTAPFGPAGASPKTFQADIAYKEELAFFKMRGAAIAELGIDSPASGGVSVRASGPALYFDDQSDPGLTPAIESDTIPPFLRRKLTLPSWLAGSADFRDFGVLITNPVEPEHAAGSGSLWPDKMYKGESPIIVTGAVPKQLIDIDDWNALTAATGFAAKAKWESTAIIASSYPHRFWTEFSNAQYTEGGPDPLANRRRKGANFSFKATRAGAASSTLTLVNATASYV